MLIITRELSVRWLIEKINLTRGGPNVAQENGGNTREIWSGISEWSDELLAMFNFRFLNSRLVDPAFLEIYDYTKKPIYDTKFN